MKQEFFAPSIDLAIRKASEKLGIPESELNYTPIRQEFGEVFGEKKVAIVVEYQEQSRDVGADPEIPLPVGPTPEEEAARAEGGTRWATFLVDGILERMNIESSTESRKQDEHIVLSVELKDGELDLRRGENRELRGAIQHVVNRSLSRAGEEGKRFIVDIGGTLDKRSEKIRRMAEELNTKIAEFKKAVHIHLMDSQDRRLLHTAVLEGKEISSQGRGEKQFRVLSLEPKKGK